MTYPHRLLAIQPPEGRTPELPHVAGFGALPVARGSAYHSAIINGLLTNRSVLVDCLCQREAQYKENSSSEDSDHDKLRWKVYRMKKPVPLDL